MMTPFDSQPALVWHAISNLDVRERCRAAWRKWYNLRDALRILREFLQKLSPIRLLIPALQKGRTVDRNPTQMDVAPQQREETEHKKYHHQAMAATALQNQ